MCGNLAFRRASFRSDVRSKRLVSMGDDVFNGSGPQAASKAGAGREKVHPTKHRGTAERERSTAPELHTRGSEV